MPQAVEQENDEEAQREDARCPEADVPRQGVVPVDCRDRLYVFLTLSLRHALHPGVANDNLGSIVMATHPDVNTSHHSSSRMATPWA